MKICFDSVVEQLDHELGILIADSKDPKFTAYLYQLKGELFYVPQNAEDIRRRAISNYDIYVAGMRNQGVLVTPYYFKAVYGDAEVEVLSEKKDSVSEDTKSEETKSEETKPEETKLEEKKPEETKFEEIKQAEDKSEETSLEEVKPEVTPAEATEPQPSVGPDCNNYIRSYYQGHPADSVQPAPGPAPYAQQMQMPNGPMYAPGYTAPAATAPSMSKKTEYAVGAIVMSVLGSVFLLTGLVYFAVNFLDTFTQGMLMYAVCGVVLAFSEFVIRRILTKLSSVFTAIGISGLFLATVVNYRSLENINLPVAGFIIGLCAILVCLFGYYRKSSLYSAIGFFAGFASSVAIGSDVTPVQYLFITLGTLFISCLWLIFPVEHQSKVVDTCMIIAELAYLFIGLGFNVITEDLMLRSVCKLVFGLVSWFVCQLVFYRSESLHSETSMISGLGIVNSIFMIFSAFIYSIVIAASGSSIYLDDVQRIILGIISYLGMVVPSAIFATLLYRKYLNVWKIFFTLFTVSGLLVVFMTESPFVVPVVYGIHLIVNKLVLLKNPDNDGMQVLDILCEVFIGVILAFSAGLFAPDVDETMIYLYFPVAVLVIAMVAAMLISSGYVFATQIITIISVTSAVCSVFIPAKLGLVCAMGMILAFTFLVNTVKKLRTIEYRFVNYGTLITEILLFHMLVAKCYASRLYELFDNGPEALIIYTIGAIFGFAFILLTLRKEYGLFFAGRYILIPIYLTWVTFLAPFYQDFIQSIILMTIAVGSVIFGFVLRRKGIRVFGLVLSIIVCAKIAFIDFVTLDDAMSKTIMYILVGALALLIGTIYMVLESKENKAAAKKNEQGAS